MLGRTIAERYVIESCVGEGAMGRVYRARHVRLTRLFAIKVLFGDLIADPNMRTRFEREAEAASRLDHPNIASTLDFGEDDGLLYLAMDYIEGDDMRTLIASGAPFSGIRTAALSRQLAEGLAHAHEHGLIHRDFKADNVLVEKHGEKEVPRIVDFGLAILPEGSSESERLTTVGIVVGTPAYMSPEQATDEDVDHRSDLYALGVLMYEMLAAKLPFDGSPTELARHNIATMPPPINKRSPGANADPSLEAIVFKLLRKRPDDRYASANDVIVALDRWRGGVSRSGAPALRAGGKHFRRVASPVESAPTLVAQPRLDERWYSRRQGLLVAVVSAAILVVAGLIYWVARDGGSAGEPTASVPAPVAAASPDAGIVARRGTPPEPASTTPDAGAVKVPKKVAKKPRRRPKRTQQNKRPKPEVAVSADALRSKYRAVGLAVDRLESERGAAAAAPYRKRYLSIQYLASLRDETQRKIAYNKLKSIASAVKRARKK